ncbi:hypothetical protein PAMP_008208 [Pampus punctatissimus]
MKDREKRASSPWIKAENPERSRATECHILVVRSRRGKEAEEEMLRIMEEEEEEEEEGWLEGGFGEEREDRLRKLLEVSWSASTRHQCEGV